MRISFPRQLATLAALATACIVGCSGPEAANPAVGTPVLVIGHAVTPPSPEPTQEALPSPSPSSSPSERPRATPKPGFYAAPEWAWMAFGDSALERAFRTSAWSDGWREMFIMEPPRAYEEAAGAEVSEAGLKRLEATLATVTNVKYAGVGYGTFDCTRNVPLEDFKRNLREIVAKLRAHEITPVMGTIPFGTSKSLSALSDYNQAVLEVRAELGVEAGPDLYQAIQDHPAWLDSRSGVYLTADGGVAVARLWVQRMAELTGYGLPTEFDSP